MLLQQPGGVTMRTYVYLCMSTRDSTACFVPGLLVPHVRTWNDFVAQVEELNEASHLLGYHYHPIGFLERASSIDPRHRTLNEVQDDLGLSSKAFL